MSGAITREDVALAYGVAARLVDLHGDRFVPFFELMESRAEEVRAREGAAGRAREAARRLSRPLSRSEPVQIPVYRGFSTT